jgi:phage recombination protein Bet
MSELVAQIPRTGDATQWTESQKALMEFAGLYKKMHTSNGEQMVLAPRAIVEAFSQTVQRTQLDPIARQIYCIERGGKYTISVGIDGARLVAQRTGEYTGQKPIEWTADGEKWVDVWLSKEPPAAARAGVMRKGFDEPLYAVATWDSYAPYYNGKLGQVWSQHGSLMLGKCAEMLALRKAFPMELSGLYVAEEMDTANSSAPQAIVPTRNWLEELKDIEDKAELRKMHRACKDAGELTPALSAEFMNHASKLTIDSDAVVEEDVQEAEIVEEVVAVNSDLLAEILAEEPEKESK